MSTSSPPAMDAMTDEQIAAVAREHFCQADGDKDGDWGPNTLNQQWIKEIGIPFARAILAASRCLPVRGEPPDDDTRDDDLWDAAQRKLQAGETLTKQEANAYFAAGLFNPINQVYFRAGLIACREYMARFVEAQSPEIAASIRANWWPKLGPDFGPPRRMNWGELVEGGGDGPPIKCRDDISPTLEALPIAMQFLMPAAAPSPDTPAQPTEEPK